MRPFLLVSVLVLSATLSQAVTYETDQVIQGDDTATGDAFGISIITDGEWLVVGASSEGGTGAAYVFRYDGSQWLQTQKLQPSDLGSGDAFGLGTSLCNEWLFVSAIGHDAAATDAGAVYVFQASGASWTQTQKLLPTGLDSGGVAADNFGRQPECDGTSMIVGMPGYDDGGSSGTNYGAGVVYTESGGTWSHQQTVFRTSAGAGASMGNNVNIDGDTLVLGGTLDHPVVNNGGVDVYRRSGATWSLEQTILNPDNANTNFGTSANSIVGDSLVVGDYQDVVSGASDAGSVRYYTRSGTTWTLQATLTSPTITASDQYGQEVFLSSETLLFVGETGGEQVHRYDLDGGAWVLDTSLDAVESGSIFGIAVYDSLTQLFIGDSGTSTGGTVYAYTIPASEQNQGAFFGENGLFYGEDKAGLADSMDLTTDALDALYGLLIIFLFGLVGLKSAGSIGGGIGAAGGFIWNLAFGLWPFWYVLFVVVGAAAFIGVRQRGGGMDA